MTTSRVIHASKRRVTAGIVVVGAAALIGFGLTATTASASAPGNNGTLKIHEQGTPSGTESNDPKVCDPNVESFGVDAGQTGTLQFSVQGGDGPTGTAAGPYAFGPADASGYFATQYFHLEPGHYKATLYGKPLPNGKLEVKAKSKVFKVICGPDTPPTTTTATSPSSTTTATTPSSTTTATTPSSTTSSTSSTTPSTTATTPPVIPFAFTAVVAKVKCVQGSGTAVLTVKNTWSDTTSFDVWLNGKQIGESFPLAVNASHSLTLTLKHGSNTVIVNGPVESTKTLTVVNNCSAVPSSHSTTPGPTKAHSAPITKLAFTGSNNGQLVFGALCVLTIGFGLKFAVRRRRPITTD